MDIPRSALMHAIVTGTASDDICMRSGRYIVEYRSKAPYGQCLSLMQGMPRSPASKRSSLQEFLYGMPVPEIYGPGQ